MSARRCLSKRQRLVETFRQDMPAWGDVVAFSFLIDQVGLYMLHEFEDFSYQPLNVILPRIIEERGHVQYGELKLEDVAKTEEGRQEAQRILNKWYPRALDMFGLKDSARSQRYLEWGLKRRTNAQARREYIQEVNPLIEKLGLQVPIEDYDRHYR